MNIKEYGEKIKAERIKQGLTQFELAEQCNIGIRTIQRIEKGKVSPRIQTIKILNEFFGIQVSNFSELKGNRINYKVIFYSGISVFFLGIMFTVAVNLVMGIAFIISGAINIGLGLRNAEFK